VDQALLGIAQVKLEKELHVEAIAIYKQILGLPHSQVKAQAQYRIAEAMEASAKKTGRKSASGFNDEAIAQYKVVAERYPDSEFAGPALGKLVDYYIETKDYARADDLLEQVFTDHPDAPFLDSMLLKWVLVAFRMGDFRKAHEKCTQLIFEYPTSDFAEKAKKILPQIEAKIK
jgi:TolA-binding protein